MQQIADWLKTLGLEQYAHCFAENDIDFDILGHLTDQDLHITIRANGPKSAAAHIQIAGFHPLWTAMFRAAKKHSAIPSSRATCSIAPFP
jgi:SAM domain (Sterile alpha motif)